MAKMDLKERPKELIQAEKFVIEGRFDEAHELMENFKNRGKFTPNDAVFCNLLKVNIMFQQGLYEDVFKLANQTYNISLELRENVLAFDVLELEIIALFLFNRLDESIQKIKNGEELLKKLPKELPRVCKIRRMVLEFLKANVYLIKNEIKKGKKHLDLSVALSKEIGDDREVTYVFLISSEYYAIREGEFDIALENIEKAIEISKNYNWKYGRALAFLIKGGVTSIKGELDQSITCYRQSLIIFKELNNKHFIAMIFSNFADYYKQLGELERSLECTESSIKLAQEVGNLRALGLYYDNLIRILIEKADLKQAQKAIEQLEQIKNQVNDNKLNLRYLIVKALLLKTSSRSRDRVEAEDILIQIIENEAFRFEINIDALLNLCELLLTELRISNDLSVLEEINSYTAQILEIAEKSHSYKLFAEIYFLKAKLALLTLDLKTARRFLTQAQRIAERFGYNQLAANISLEHEKLQNQLSMWDDLNEEDVPLSERIKLARVDEQIGRLLRNRISFTAQVKEKQITVHKERKICIVCKGDISGFMYTCICDALYCEKCARVITAIENMCWICNTPFDITKPIKPYKEKEVGRNDINKKKIKNPKEDD